MNDRRGKDRQFRAMQRRRRLDGELEDWRTRPRPVRGPFSRLSKRLKDHAEQPSRPWRRAEYHDPEWRPRVQEIVEDFASEFSLIIPATGALNPRQVAALSADQISVSGTVHELLAQIRTHAQGELDQAVKAGNLSRRKADKELQRFDEATADRVAQRMAREVLAGLRDAVKEDLPRFKHIKPGQPPYPRGGCPDCDRGGPAAMALVPGKQCGFCGGYPAGERSE